MAMRKFLMVVFILCVSLAVISAANPNLIVYKTKTGDRYHLDGCSSLSRSKIAITLEKAVNSGLTPCSRCNPPELDKKHHSLFRVIELTSYKDARIADMLKVTVSRTVDGDTIRVSITDPPVGLSNEETIRLLGVDTPETVHPFKPVEYFGKEASEYTKKLTGQTAYLAFDWNLRDNYGRLLAYIYLDSGECFNAKLIEDGYGFAYLTFPFQFMDEFRNLERSAREERRGLWNGPN
jgi:micrococcal nuclease